MHTHTHDLHAQASALADSAQFLVRVLCDECGFTFETLETLASIREQIEADVYERLQHGRKVRHHSTYWGWTCRDCERRLQEDAHRPYQAD
jgi:hypothetical protein